MSITRVRSVSTIKKSDWNNWKNGSQWASISKDPKLDSYNLTIHNSHNGVRAQMSVTLTLEDLIRIHSDIDKEIFGRYP